MRFCSDDGKMFDTMEECKKHEDEVLAKLRAENKKKEKLAELKANVDKAAQELDKLIKEYEKESDSKLYVVMKNGAVTVEKGVSIRETSKYNPLINAILF